MVLNPSWNEEQEFLGEKQRLYAEAIYINPSLIIFDEATSSLDDNTEREIVQLLKILRQNNYINDCPQTKHIKNCDKCFKVENGNLKEEII